MRINSCQELVEEARRVGPGVVGIAWPDECELLSAAAEATRLELARCVLVGDESVIRRLADSQEVDLAGMAILDEKDPGVATTRVMHLVSQGEVETAMKGRVKTRLFLKAALQKEFNLRTGRLLSHVAVFEIPGFPRLLLISDAGVVMAPTLEQKVEIVQNAIDVAMRLGIEQPKVAILAAHEMVDPRLLSSLDGACLSKMADRGQIHGGLVDGPLALDNAISLESARIKGVSGPVGGHADVLIVPEINSANMLVKSITYFARGRMSGVVVGARVPLVLTSRSDNSESKLLSIALGVLLVKSADGSDGGV